VIRRSDSSVDSEDDYRRSHTDPSKPAEYDPKFFTEGTTLQLMWEIERRIITEVIESVRPRPARALDFACGTGRILSHVGDLVSDTTGVDVSGPMLAVARERCPRSTIIQADLTSDPDRLEGDFDLITSFRFLLNAEPDLRAGVLKALRARIRTHGVLVVNFHFNPNSLTGLYIRLMTRVRGRELPKMATLREACGLLRTNGFEPASIHGYGYLLHRTVRVPFPAIKSRLERGIARWDPAPSLAHNFIVVCRAAPSTFD